MDDWERHFTEKSRRRAETERRERHRQRARRIIIGVALATVIVGGLIAMAILT